MARNRQPRTELDSEKNAFNCEACYPRLCRCPMSQKDREEADCMYDEMWGAYDKKPTAAEGRR